MGKHPWDGKHGRNAERGARLGTLGRWRVLRGRLWPRGHRGHGQRTGVGWPLGLEGDDGPEAGAGAQVAVAAS